jgi:outer membrane immunogenic protein
MRGVVVAMIGLGLAQPAFAADPILRGSFAPAAAPTYRNWEGFFVGGDVGVGGGGANFNSGESLGIIVANTFWESNGVGNWATGGKADTGHAAQFGAFIGYNAQWDDIVLGLEATYHHTDLSAGTEGRTPPSANTYINVPYPSSPWSLPTAVSGGGWANLTDFGTVRARAGWAIDRFLPYVTGGVALGRGSYGSTATVSWVPAILTQASANPPPSPMTTSGSSTVSNTKTNALIYGWTAGLGMDVEVTRNIFIRAEYEFIQFSQMRINLNSGRIGAGFKF